MTGVDLVSATPGRLAQHRAEWIGYADQHYWRALAEELTAPSSSLCRAQGFAASTQRHEPAGARAPRTVGLLDRIDAHPRRALGGEQAADRALRRRSRHEPRLLIADEPTGELDPRHRRRDLRPAGDTGTRAPRTVVVVSHDPESTAIADRIVTSAMGRVSEEEAGEGATVVVGRGGWLTQSQRRSSAGCRDRRACAGDIGRGVVELRARRQAIGAKPVPGPVAPGTEGVAGRGTVAHEASTRKPRALAGVDRARTGSTRCGRPALQLGEVDTARAPRRASTLPDEGSVTIGGTGGVGASPCGASRLQAPAHRSRRSDTRASPVSRPQRRTSSPH